MKFDNFPQTYNAARKSVVGCVSNIIHTMGGDYGGGTRHHKSLKELVQTSPSSWYFPVIRHFSSSLRNAYSSEK